MKLYLYEIAEVLSAKNDVTQFENVPLRNAEFDSRLMAMTLSQQPLLRELLPPYLSVQWQRELISWSMMS